MVDARCMGTGVPNESQMDVGGMGALAVDWKCELTGDRGTTHPAALFCVAVVRHSKFISER